MTPNGPHILLELIAESTAPVGSVSIDEPPASFVSCSPDGHRRLFVFGWQDGRPGLWESLIGVDGNTAAARFMLSITLEQLSDLTQPFALDAYVAGMPVVLRFTLKGQEDSSD